MMPKLNDRLEPLFRRASELDPEVRNSLLASLPAEDRAEIESLMAFDRPDDRIPLEGSGVPSLPNVKQLLKDLRSESPEASCRVITPLELLGEDDEGER